MNSQRSQPALRLKLLNIVIQGGPHIPQEVGLPMPKESQEIRLRITDSLTFADRVEICLLDPAWEIKGSHVFPLLPLIWQRSTSIYEVKILDGEPMSRLRSLWSATLQEEEGGQAHCHYPIHGLRFWSAKKLLFETSLCWICNNYFAFKEGKIFWLGLPGGYPEGPGTTSCAELRKILSNLLPIPEALARKVSARRRRGENGSNA